MDLNTFSLKDRITILKNRFSSLEKNGLTHPHVLSNMRLQIIKLELFQDELEGFELYLLEEIEEMKELNDLDVL